jgi:hypothetical protein
MPKVGGATIEQAVDKLVNSELPAEIRYKIKAISLKYIIHSVQKLGLGHFNKKGEWIQKDKKGGLKNKIEYSVSGKSIEPDFFIF